MTEEDRLKRLELDIKTQRSRMRFTNLINNCIKSRVPHFRGIAVISCIFYIVHGRLLDKQCRWINKCKKKAQY